MRAKPLVAAACWALGQVAFGQDADLQALELADRTSTAAQTASPWRGFVEASASTSCGSDGSCQGVNERLSLNLAFSKLIVPGLRAVFESRLDLNSRPQFLYPKQTNTLKEAYLAWQPSGRWMLDVGRINLRYGAGLGYNPTDFFRAHALRTVVSVDPASSRANRLGTVAVRGQSLWDGGSVTALVAPKLAERPSDGIFSADLGSTNDRNRWLIATSQRLAPGFSPQWLYYQEEGADPQFGLNATWAIDDRVVAFFEWKGGRGTPPQDTLFGSPAPVAFRSQSTAGLTISAGRRATLTLEYQYNGTAADRQQWQALAQTSPWTLRQYLVDARDRQDLPNRHSAFAHVRWVDMLGQDFDVSALTRVNLDDRSTQLWVEAVHHLKSVDIALQWQTNRGRADSEFGITPPHRAWQALVRYHF